MADSATPAKEGFGDRLDRAVQEKRSCLVVGLDPVLERLPPDAFRALGTVASGGEGLTAKASAAFTVFLCDVIDAVAEAAVAVKPNTAFFERYGAAGWECLQQVCRHAQKAARAVLALEQDRAGPRRRRGDLMA